MPSYITPNKDVCGATAEQRLAMTRLATADNPYFTVSDMEMRRQGNSYTVDTLRELRRFLPAHVELCFLVGADAAGSFRGVARGERTWRPCEVRRGVAA